MILRKISGVHGVEEMCAALVLVLKDRYKNQHSISSRLCWFVLLVMIWDSWVVERWCLMHFG